MPPNIFVIGAKSGAWLGVGVVAVAMGQNRETSNREYILHWKSPPSYRCEFFLNLILYWSRVD